MALEVKQGEAKTVRFTITDADGDVVDVSAATFSLVVKQKLSDTSAVFTKSDTDFDKSQGSSGIVTVPISAANTNQTPGSYIMELTTEFSSTNIDKSLDIPLIINKAIYVAES